MLHPPGTLSGTLIPTSLGRIVPHTQLCWALISPLKPGLRQTCHHGTVHANPVMGVASLMICESPSRSFFHFLEIQSIFAAKLLHCPILFPLVQTDPVSDALVLTLFLASAEKAS